MSSGSDRGIPTGVVRQGNRIVGGLVMPEDEEVFIREFNHCYGQLRMSVAPNGAVAAKRVAAADPHTFQIPTWFRHVWHAPPAVRQEIADLPSGPPSESPP